MGSSSSIIGPNNSVVALNDDVVWEILRRLPTKSLMRFKCVSKQWNKIIREPFLAKSHIGGFHGLLITHSTDVGSADDHHQVRSVANECFEAGSFIRYKHNVVKNSNIRGCYRLFLDEEYIDYCGYSVTNFEKGLCVLYDDYTFTLFNIATHELLDLPLKSPEEEKTKNSCYLGFEPVMGVYKLVRFFFDTKYENIDDGNANFTCGGYLQICTLGGKEENDLDWRSVDEAPQLTHYNSVFGQNICVNGILYLTQFIVGDGNVFLERFVGFNLSTETAPQLISLPDCFTTDAKLVQLGGSPALINVTSEISVVWILKDNHTWIKSHSMDLMGICGFDLNYVGTLPTGEALLAPNRVTRDNPNLLIYKYDHIQNKLLNWIELHVPFYSWCYGELCHLGYHEDNILPLGSLIKRSSDS